MKKYDVIVFDMDGTLMDSAQSIIHAMDYAEAKMGLPTMAVAEKKKCIGPPILESYMGKYHLDEVEAEKAATHFRQYQNGPGIAEVQPYPGIEALLSMLKETGHKIALATLKRQDIAKTILENTGLSHYFDIIGGAAMDEHSTKASVLKTTLADMGIAPADALLIGDTDFDAEGAWIVGVTFIAVTYGYGYQREEDVSPYSPLYIAHFVDDLIQFMDTAN